jgi:hypothetical protein
MSLLLSLLKLYCPLPDFGLRHVFSVGHEPPTLLHIEDEPDATEHCQLFFIMSGILSMVGVQLPGEKSSWFPRHLAVMALL